MGLKRFIWRTTGIGRTVDTVKNIIDEGSLIDGVKRTVKEYYCEDNPITSTFYNIGKYDGKKEGYARASDQYEEKLLKQADAFLNQTQIFENERDAYEQLLNAYENEIDNLSKKVNKTEMENEYLQQLLLRERKLKAIAS